MAIQDLFVFDEALDVESLPPSAGPCSLLPLTSDAALVARAAARLASGGAVVTVLPAARRIDAEAAALRTGLPAWGAALGRALVEGVPLRRRLLLPAFGVSAWWFTLLSERNPLKTDLFLRAAQLRVIDAALTETGAARLSVGVGDASFHAVLEALARRRGAAFTALASKKQPERWTWVRAAAAGLLALARSAWRALAARRALGRPLGRLPRGAGLLGVTYFPGLEKAALVEGRFRSKYVAALQEQLPSWGVRAVWLLVYAPFEGSDFGAALEDARRLSAAGEPVAFIEEFLTPGDFLRAFAGWAVTAARATRLWPLLPREVLLAAPFTGPEAEALLAPLWRRSLLGPQLVEGLLAVLAFRRAFDALPAAERCVYLCEFLPWELGLNAARRGRSGPKTLGFQHGALLGNLFNYFRDPSECSEPVSPETLPLPDALAADGQLPAELLAGCGYPGLARAEALRYQYIGPWLERAVPAGPAETLLVAGSSNRRECEVLAALVHAAYPEAGARRIVFRSHPLSPFGPVFARLGIDPAAAAYGEDSGDLADALCSAALVLTAGSGVAVEALAFGCEVAVPLVCDALSMSPLDAFPGMSGAVAGPQELRAAFAQALKSDRTARREAGRAFLRRYWDLERGLPRWKGLLAG